MTELEGTAAERRLLEIFKASAAEWRRRHNKQTISDARIEQAHEPAPPGGPVVAVRQVGAKVIETVTCKWCGVDFERVPGTPNAKKVFHTKKCGQSYSNNTRKGAARRSLRLEAAELARIGLEL